MKPNRRPEKKYKRKERDTGVKARPTPATRAHGEPRGGREWLGAGPSTAHPRQERGGPKYASRATKKDARCE